MDEAARHDQQVVKEVFQLEFNNSLVTLMQMDIQQQMRDANSKFQSRAKLDDEIDKMWMSKRRYNKKRRTTNDKIQLIERLYINKASGQQQHKVWKLGEWKATIV